MTLKDYLIKVIILISGLAKNPRTQPCDKKQEFK